MLQKFKITSCVFILCLFALTLITVTPVFAAGSAAYNHCMTMKTDKSVSLMNQKKKCFVNLVDPRNQKTVFEKCLHIKPPTRAMSPQAAFQLMKQKTDCVGKAAFYALGAGAPAGAPVAPPAVTAAPAGVVAPAVMAAGNAPQRVGKRGPGKASKRPLCNIRKGFLNKKGLKVRQRECR